MVRPLLYPKDGVWEWLWAFLKLLLKLTRFRTRHSHSPLQEAQQGYSCLYFLEELGFEGYSGIHGVAGLFRAELGPQAGMGIWAPGTRKELLFQPAGLDLETTARARGTAPAWSVWLC